MQVDKKGWKVSDKRREMCKGREESNVNNWKKVSLQPGTKGVWQRLRVIRASGNIFFCTWWSLLTLSACIVYQADLTSKQQYFFNYKRALFLRFFEPIVICFHLHGATSKTKCCTEKLDCWMESSIVCKQATPIIDKGQIHTGFGLLRSTYVWFSKGLSSMNLAKVNHMLW